MIWTRHFSGRLSNLSEGHLIIFHYLTIHSEIIFLLAIPPCAKYGKEHTEDNDDNDDVN